MKNEDRLSFLERQALAKVSRALELVAFHLREGSAADEDVRAALIEVCGTLSAMPVWIADGTAPGFASYMTAWLQAIKPSMERIEADDIPRPDWENLCEEPPREPPDPGDPEAYPPDQEWIRQPDAR